MLNLQEQAISLFSQELKDIGIDVIKDDIIIETLNGNIIAEYLTYKQKFIITSDYKLDLGY